MYLESTLFEYLLYYLIFQILSYLMLLEGGLNTQLLQERIIYANIPIYYNKKKATICCSLIYSWK